MKNRIIINLETNRHAEYDHMSSADICFTCDELPDLGLIESIDKEIKRLTALSYRNKELYMEKSIRVDWGSFAFISQREEGFPPRWITSNCLGLELKLTPHCKLQLIAPPIHFDSRLLQNPNYKF